ncbi:transcription factor IIIB 90 kDa subunit-like [Sycon ciliatum]|uniref:transcription factor IIIB 90 kDa subunit-like n=1 Tax=Sycon ciliatum TaxID=27933 RepID=UPI0020A96175|eukprot:scpid39044/ scgid30806/ Transcription factor IIIB 90 kDa subunit; B-related factor 1
MPTTCQSCGCSDLETDQARGDVVCTNCGAVLEEGQIVSEVGFLENASGGTNVIGQYVSSEGTRGRSMRGNFHHGFGRESKEVTLQNGRRRIAGLAQQLQLNQHHVDSAYMFFKMALTNRLTRGRKSSHIAAACLYLVCRSEGTPHMLLDFSDALQTNVYLLGRAYLHLATALCIHARAVDPCLYIPRFAHKLDFGDKTHEVSMTAMRLVSRMKRDWMDVGRRPAGLCGAALLVAARLHNFNRSQKDIIRVVRVCDATLKKRLTEFEQTPSSNLTIDEFLKIDLEEESDPPSFGQMNAKKEDEEGAEGQSSGAGEDGQSVDPDALSELERMQNIFEEALEGGESSAAPSVATSTVASRAGSPVTVAQEADESPVANGTAELLPVTAASSSNAPSANADGSGTNAASGTADSSKSDSSLAVLEGTRTALEADVETALAAGGISSITGLSRYAEEDSATAPEKPESVDVEGTEPAGESLSDLDDDEMDGFILSKDEAELKAQMWEEENKDYLAAQKVKQEKEEADRAAGIKKPPKKRRNLKTHANMKPCKSAGEAIERVLQEKKISSKINYDVLKSLQFSLPSAAATSQSATSTAAASIEPKTESDESLAASAPAAKRVKFAPKI